MVRKLRPKSSEDSALVICSAAQPFGTLPAVFAPMLYFMIAQLFSLLLDGLVIRSRTDQPQDLEFLLLRQQLLILQRLDRLT